MTINKYLNRVKLLDQLIRQQNTGTPKELAQKLSIGERQLYNLIEELKEMGSPVQYNRCQKSYFYEYPVKLNIDFCVEPVKDI